MVIIKTLIFAFLSTVGFSVLFTTPKDSIVKAGIVGSIGWGLYYISSLVLNNSIISTLIASISIGIVGELFAKYYKKPATVFIIPGIIPLVPGAGMYYTMFYLVQREYLQAAIIGSETLFMASAIAIGVIVSTIFSRSLRHFRKMGN